MTLNKQMISSKSVEWETPQDFFDELNKEFNFTLDPCATHDNFKCKKYFTDQEDGLKQDWSKDVVFMNPPYKRCTKIWMLKAYDEFLKGSTVVCLIPCGPGRNYWHELIFPNAAQIRFIKGFLKFSGNKNGAPFSFALVVFSKKKYKNKFVWVEE